MNDSQGKIAEGWVAVTAGRGQTARWYSPTVWQTMKISAWWRLLRAQRFRVALSKVPRVLVTTGMTAGNSVLGVLQSVLFSQSIRATPIQPNPIFILGHWRTGTTHLHNLIALDGRLSFPTTYECGAPHHCLLTDRLYPRIFAWQLPAKRLMDDMGLGFDLPQEDEWALMNLGEPSPYWAFGFLEDRKGRRFLTLTGVGAQEREHWEQTFQQFLRLMSFRHPGKPLVLKSPTHTARLAVLWRMFPKARFLHIVREPFTVFASTVRLWRENLAAGALTPWTEQQLEQHVLRMLPDMYQDFERVRARLPSGQFHQVRYEDLVRDPLAILEECYRQLGLGDFSVVRSRVEGYLATLSEYHTNEYAVSAEGKAAIRAAWGSLFRQWGYEI